ncbi:hypothetical protein K8S19_08060 [bacterium]|nr:hypothetical protein [bacterium]
MRKKLSILAWVIPLFLAMQIQAETMPTAVGTPSPAAEQSVIPETTPTPEPQPVVSKPAMLTEKETAMIENPESSYKINSLFEGRITSNGGYGTAGYKPTRIDGETGHMIGGRGGWIINHSLMIGGAGYNLADSQIQREFDGEMKKLHFGYGGIELGYTFFSDQLIHLVVHTLFAGGGIGTLDKVYADEDEDGNKKHTWEGPVDTVFVVEPMIYAELNVTEWFRVCLGGGYRHVEGCELKGVSNQDLSGASAELLFKFGYF